MPNNQEMLSDDELRARALKLYRPPFRHQCGYILDSNGAIVADESVLRVRGWGHISKLENPERLQELAGELMAEAMTKFWREQLSILSGRSAK